MLFSIKKREKSHMIQFVPILLLLSVILIFALSATQLTTDNRAHEREIVAMRWSGALHNVMLWRVLILQIFRICVITMVLPTTKNIFLLIISTLGAICVRMSQS